MSLKINLLPSKPLQQIPRFQNSPFPSSRPHFNNTSTRLQISILCTKNNNNNNNNNSSFTDAELAFKLAKEVEKLQSQILQREEALSKSRKLLFQELSSYVGLEVEQVKKKWRKMDEDEKWVLVKGFVSEWSDNFHPLSARSVKELVDEYLVEEEQVLGDSGGIMLFPSLRKLIGFSEK
ncbi:hypothetical protein ACH5RR_022344 [Cinchona calisaya]|uniref:DUF7026 domain-containing protein n=1 Tax=Cinchona calisaya TaxID=153742 RepID=A0ABD2Z7J3_9GENT